MSDIHITVEAYGGTNIPERAIPQMVALANRLGVNVHADLNGVTVMAKPYVDPQALAARWHEELLSKRSIKMACVQPDSAEPTWHCQGCGRDWLVAAHNEDRCPACCTSRISQYSSEADRG